VAVCIDTSAALRWLVPQPTSAAAAVVIGQAFEHREPVIAPPLLFAEATSVLHKFVFDGALIEHEARTALQDLLALPIKIVTGDFIYLRAYDLASRFSQARAYDTQFIAVAEHGGARLITADRTMYKRSKSVGLLAELLP
jgi:predicted nucleic acid-binding protein